MKFLIFIALLSYNICLSQQTIAVEQKNISSPVGIINLNDTICLKEIERAKKDIESNILKYSLTQLDIDFDKIETIIIFKKIMNQYNIEVLYLGNNLPKTDITPFCYEKYMRIKIKQKFGENFIDNNIKKADSLFIVKNPDKIFSNREIFDKQLLYPSANNIESQNKDYQEDYFKIFKVPNGFIYEEKNAYSYVRFNLSKDGNLSNFQVETKFVNNINQKHALYYKKKLLKFVKKIKWIPQKKYGVRVNSEVLLTFFH